jgi:hypothetical protein
VLRRNDGTDMSARFVDAQGIFAFVKGIADTGFLVAFANSNDKHHNPWL